LMWHIIVGRQSTGQAANGGVVADKRMQGARDPDKCVLCWPHRRVADARRYTLVRPPP
jgi:hypothetical protein